MSITYKISEIEEPITKNELRTLKKFLGEFTIETNEPLSGTGEN